MSDDERSRIHKFLDGVSTPKETAELNDWIKADPKNAACFADVARLHNQLGEVFRSTQSVEQATRRMESRIKTPVSAPTLLRRRVAFIGGVTTIAALLMIGVWLIWPTPLNAAEELDRLIENSTKSIDRTYVIRNLETELVYQEDRRAPIDGALLHVRKPNQYVLIRWLPNGGATITGCDGEHAWSIVGDGPVRVSKDVLRFRGPLPGHQSGIPFLDLRTDLEQLREAYNVTLLPSKGLGQSTLLAEKKSAEYRGPKRIEIRYSSWSGVIQRMIFDGMPKARGGPNRISVELKNQTNLGPDFFNHTRHHGVDRRVIEED